MSELPGVKDLKDCVDGWKCPVCKKCFERYHAHLHLRGTHPQEYETMLAEATAKSPLMRAQGAQDD